MSGEESTETAAEESAAAANCDDECDIVRSNKGGPKLIHRGYIYTVHKQRPGFVRWRCTRRSLFCKGSMMTTSIEQGTTKKVLTPHNHVPDRHAVQVTIARGRQCEAAAAATEDSSSPENKNALDRLKNLGTAVQVKAPQLAQALAHHKRKTRHSVELIDDEMPTLLDATKPAAPLKVSKRIMEKRQLRLLSCANPKAKRKGDEYFSQIKSSKDTKMKIVKVTRPEAVEAAAAVAPPTAACPIEMVQKQASASLLVRKLPMQEPEIEAEDDEVCLKWNSHHSNMQSAFPFLLAREQYVDVTLCSEGQSIRCHKLVLSACSTYFDEIISGMTPWQHPVIYLKGIPFWVLKALIDFMYVGEVSIEQSKLQYILDAGEELKIKGLTTAIPQSTPFSYVQVPDAANPNHLPHHNRRVSSASSPVKLGGHNLVPTKAPNVFKIALSRDHLTKLSSEAASKLFKSALQRKTRPGNMVSLLNKNAHVQQPQLQMHIKEEKVDKMPEVEAKNVKDAAVNPVSKEKEKPAKQVPKRPAKRRLSETNDPDLPDHLQFVRKGTRSRPLVKTPKIYQTEVSPKRESRDRCTPVIVGDDSSSSFATLTPTPHKVSPPPEKQPPVLKPVSLLRERPLFSATSDKPYHQPPTFGAPVSEDDANDEDDYLQISQIKQEPIDISETDVSYGNFINEEHVLRFDEDEPGENDDEDDLLLDADGDCSQEEFMEVITPTLQQDSQEGSQEDIDDAEQSGQVILGPPREDSETLDTSDEAVLFRKENEGVTD